MKELTYILGAGASYQSIPIVKTFSSRFNAFLEWIDSSIIKDMRFELDQKQKFGILHNLGKGVHQEFESHQSFDTYFKKLFHTKQDDRIREAKKILNLYFIWEHLSPAVSKPETYDESIFWKHSTVDKRYDALIAGLLQPIAGEADPYCKVNFITWNYDLNLLLSLKNYFFHEGTIGEFIKKIDKGNGIWQINEKIAVQNVNGYFYCSNFDNLCNLNNAVAHDMIYQKIKIEGYFHDSYEDKDSELIKFAWESNNSLVETAKKGIINSKNIVVVGYTFPLYNRLIDLEYLPQNLITTKKIFIQDPNADNVSQSLIDNYQLQNLTGLESKLISITNCDSFYVPSDIFGVAELGRRVSSYAFGN